MKSGDFGGRWTQEKLELLRKYISAYTKIFRRNRRARYFETVYVDAFAGAGHGRPRGSREPEAPPLFPELADPAVRGFLEGSPRIALEVEPRFHRYLFIERDPASARELGRLKSEFSDKAASIQIVAEDANVFLTRWCRETDWSRTRAFVLLDPFGMQVEWSLVEAIARTEAIDLLLLFPLGVAVNRMLMRRKPPTGGWAKALDRIFGTGEWREAFYRVTRKSGLFGPIETPAKATDLNRIGQFVLGRLETVFCGVASRPFRLLNSRNVPLYLLCFAAGNPKGAPTAVKIAEDILGR
ncbi:MAG TPA: three-Cys-motif partner protein TcmP [Planctomycetota bacterium]|nr:three-Cys-motif partner protein TcmP [Planctomycetota bacterium]